MKKEKDGFFAKMLHSDHKIFEISMFGISVILSLALVIGIGYFTAYTYFNNDVVTEEEANALSVTDGALTVTTEQPEATATPDVSGNMIENDELAFSIEEDLASAKSGYTTANVNMRSEPSLTASVVAKVPSGAKLSFIGLRDKEWMEVEYNGSKGYINAMYLSTDKPAPIQIDTPEPVSTPAAKTPKPTKKPTVTKKPKKTKKPKATKEPDEAVITEEPTDAPTEAPTDTPTEKPTEKPTPAPTDTPMEKQTPDAGAAAE